LTPRQHAEALALAKAKDVAARYPDCLVIGADTLIDYDGEIIAKPPTPKGPSHHAKALQSSAQSHHRLAWSA